MVEMATALTTHSTSNQSSPGEYQPDFYSHLQARDKRYKRQIRYVRLGSRIGSFVLSSFVIGSLSYALATYYQTRSRIIPGTTDQHPWVTPTTLWPTIMLLVIASITWILNSAMLFSYFCGVEKANRASNIASWIGYAMLGAHIIVWAVAMGLFRMANDGTDLWGYSCGGLSDEIQDSVQSFLDFGKLCTVQTGAWYSAILEAVNYLLAFVATLLSLVRLRHKKRMMSFHHDSVDEKGLYDEKKVAVENK